MILLKTKVFGVLRMLALVAGYILMAGGLQILLGVVAIIVAMVAGFTATDVIDSLTENMLLAAALSLVGIIILGAAVSRLYKVKFSQLGMGFTPHWSRNYAIGIGVGTFSIGIVWLVAVLLGGYEIQLTHLTTNVWLAILSNLGVMLFVGYYEEALTRGLMVFVGVKNKRLFNAVAIGLIFSLMHFWNDSYSVFSMINTFLVAIVLSMLTWVSGDLWVAIGYHAFWNFVMGSVFGVNVSGNVMEGSLLVSKPNGFALINGGGYGLESSLVCTALLLLQIILLYLLFLKSDVKSKNKESQEELSGIVPPVLPSQDTQKVT